MITLRSIVKYKKGNAYYYTIKGELGTIIHMTTGEGYLHDSNKTEEYFMDDLLLWDKGTCQPLWSCISDGLMNNEDFCERFRNTVTDLRKKGFEFRMPNFIESKMEGSEYVQINPVGIKEPRKNKEFLNKNKKVKDIMNNFGLEFGKITDDSLAMSPMGVAIKAKEGYRVYNPKTEELIDVGDFVIVNSDMQAFFAMPVQSIKVGDLLKIEGKYGYLTKEFDGKKMHLINPACGTAFTKIIAKNMLGCQFFTKIVSMMDMMGGNGDTNGDSPMGQMFGGMNPMMAMMFCSGSSGGTDTGMGNMMQMMMMMGNMFKPNDK